MTVKQFISGALFVLTVLFHTPAFSHPHVFITQKVKIVFDEKGLAGFAIFWAFDDIFTAAITGDYDKNRNNILEKDEVAVIAKEAFSYLVNYNYFTFIKINGKPFPVKYVRDFRAALAQNKLLYTFFIPCHVPATAGWKRITVASYDPTNYTAIAFNDSSLVSIENAGALNIKKRLEKSDSERVNLWTLSLDFCTQ